MIGNVIPYKVDGEVGRFAFITHKVMNQGHIQFDTAFDVFPELKAKEFYRTVGFKEIAMIYGDTERSYRKTAALINRIRFQEEGGTPYRTLQENTEKEGIKLIDYIEEKTKRILKENGFTEDGVWHSNTIANEPVTLPQQMISEAAEQCLHSDMYNGAIDNPVCYEDTEKTVNISIDDVIVKKQEESRQKGGRTEKGKRKYVHNTVAHVSKGDQSYTLNGYGTKEVLFFLIALINLQQ